MAQVFFGGLMQGAPAVGVIMAGGQGTRFWPLSRKRRPKQLLSLAQSTQTLLQATVARLEPLIPRGAMMVVTNNELKDPVMLDSPGVSVLVEPQPRGTAPCIGYAAVKILQAVGDVPMACFPADHYIENTKVFLENIELAVRIAREEEQIVCLGIQPTTPETGFGYIRRGDEFGKGTYGSEGAYVVRQFVEKPDYETAARYLASGEYSWNAGMFIFRPTVILKAIQQHMPELGALLEQIGGEFDATDEFERISPLFAAASVQSIDFGVMEKATNRVVVPGRGFQWSDIGSWDVWAQVVFKKAVEPRADGNLTRGDVVTVDSRDCVIVAESRFVGVVGLERTIVVETEDALLVCSVDKAQEVKHVVDALKAQKREQLL